MTADPSVSATFRDDVVAALSAWRSQPLLPLTALGVSAVAPFITGNAFHGLVTGPPALTLAFIAVILLGFGWTGTQFIWYWRAFKGLSFRFPLEVFSFTWSFMARYVLLYAFVTFPFGLATFVIGYELGPGAPDPAGFAGLITLYALLAGIGLTFALPALAFSTRRGVHAITIGVGMIRRDVARTLPYLALSPAVTLSSFAMQRILGQSLVMSAFATLLGLFATGVIASYYLRFEQPYEDRLGAALAKV